MFALSAHPDPQVSERTLMAALDDPRQRDDPDWVESVVLAVRNLAASGGYDELDRVGRRLLSHPLVDAAARRRVERLLAEHLPGGGGRRRGTPR
jgi:hypothetical protein